MTMLIDSIGKSLLYCIASFYSIGYCLWAYSYLSSPLRYRLCFSPESETYVIAPIVRLFLGSRPQAVFLTVWTILVETVQGSSLWALSHVFEECCKIFPTWVNGDSPSPIVSIVRVVRIVAPLKHGYPRRISRMPFLFSGMHMRRVHSSFLKATQQETLYYTFLGM